MTETTKSAYNIVDDINYIIFWSGMMDERITDIYNLMLELSWNFGDHGFNGECCADLS
ncbi:hypothetical protein DHBDCA_p175 [Dehalobacter sp. DCA]|nr:hypothetical protein DHBDCA_p175 [Dehalobacter sp. DCA]